VSGGIDSPNDPVFKGFKLQDSIFTRGQAGGPSGDRDDHEALPLPRVHWGTARYSESDDQTMEGFAGRAGQPVGNPEYTQCGRAMPISLLSAMEAIHLPSGLVICALSAHGEMLIGVLVAMDISIISEGSK